MALYCQNTLLKYEWNDIVFHPSGRKAQSCYHHKCSSLTHLNAEKEREKKGENAGKEKKENGETKMLKSCSNIIPGTPYGISLY